MDSNVFIPLVVTAGGIMLALLFPAIVALWQESKDLETAAFFLSVTVKVFLLLDPLVTNPMVLLQKDTTQEVADTVLRAWSLAIPHMLVLLFLVPIYRLTQQHGVVRKGITSFLAWVTKAGRTPATPYTVEKPEVALSLIVTVISVTAFWFAHWGLVTLALR